DALFMPTLLECFSASYAEAMAMEKPILTSDLGFARTVCEDAALYFNPVDAKDISEKIRDLVKNRPLQQQLAVNGKKRLSDFSDAEDRAIKYLEICKQLVDERKN
ncbi:MAG: glycosyltransferase, partial [Balneolaceae bacterium]